jgi:hypothetical protein
MEKTYAQIGEQYSDFLDKYWNVIGDEVIDEIDSIIYQYQKLTGLEGE